MEEGCRQLGRGQEGWGQEINREKKEGGGVWEKKYDGEEKKDGR